MFLDITHYQEFYSHKVEWANASSPHTYEFNPRFCGAESSSDRGDLAESPRVEGSDSDSGTSMNTGGMQKST